MNLFSRRGFQHHGPPNEEDPYPTGNIRLDIRHDDPQREAVRQKRIKLWEDAPMENVLEDNMVKSHRQTRTLPPDTYSILVFTNWISWSGIICILIFLYQMLLYALICWGK